MSDPRITLLPTASRDQPAVAMQQAITAYGRGEWAEAEQLCRKILAERGDYFDALNLLGVIAARTRRTAEAATWLARAVAVKPGDAAAHSNYGNVLKALKRFDEALHSFECALKISPDYVIAYNNRANTLQELRRFDDALDSYERALKIDPRHVEAWYNRGNTLQQLKRFDDALDSYQRALKLKPDYAEAHNNRGVTLQELKRFNEALYSYDCALRIRPDYVVAYNNRGNTLHELKRFDDALDSYERALKINPDHVEAYYNRGNTLRELKRFDEALDSYARGLKLKPDYDALYGIWLHLKMQLCDWSNFDSLITELSAKIQQEKKTASPFPVLTLIDSLSLQRQAAETWVGEWHAVSRVMPVIGKRGRHDKIRVGYFSGDYRNHPISTLTAEMFERHDRARFEVTAFSFGPDSQDEMRQRMERAFDRFIDVRGESDPDIVRLARTMELDIAVDLGGFTEGCRPNVIAMRAAPLQVSYLGYLGTWGAECMDYLIADPTIIPVGGRKHYAEKIVYLPSYQVNDSKRAISDRTFTREELGLPRTGFVFCCFNANYKITPGTFDCWMRILRQVQGSVLFLFAGNLTVENNLRKEALIRGVAADRLVFGTRLPAQEYLARYRTADLFLDTLPYNAGTTASDALWAGLPVLTRMGESFPARVAASLLNAVGLPELIATTEEQYEAMAIELAGDPDKLAELKERLRRNRTTMPLFDTRQFTRHLEDAYTQMYERYQADLSPEHIYVAP